MSVLESITACLERIHRLDPQVNAFTAVLDERALNRAAAVDAALAAGEASVGPLAGVPFAVKNLFDVAGLVTLAGSRIERERPGAAPAAMDATAITRLEAAGAILVGALNMDEYAYGFTTENTHYGPTCNPHDLARMSGGSSGGSGAAVAAGLVPITLGTDTNGSIRVPASLCGTFGLRPTFGRLSRGGSFPVVASLDTIGLLARDVTTLAAGATLLDERLVAGEVEASATAQPPMSLLVRLVEENADLRQRVGELDSELSSARAGMQATQAIPLYQPEPEPVLQTVIVEEPTPALNNEQQAVKAAFGRLEAVQRGQQRGNIAPGLDGCRDLSRCCNALA